MRSSFLLGGILAAGLLAGCQTPMQHALNQAVNFGTGLPEEMQGRNISATVAFDEAWAGSYSYAARNQNYLQGLESGSPEYRMRAVRINMRHTDWGIGYRQGSKMFYTTAMVPDHLPPLKAGDWVEVRQSGTWNTVKDFAKTGEGNIVIKVTCSSQMPEPGLSNCVSKLPKIADYWGFGATGTPYPASVKEYGYTFTEMYDNDGKTIRK